MSGSGYSGTPLARKLGIKPGMRVRLLAPPPRYWPLLSGEGGIEPEEVRLLDASVGEAADFTHLFAATEGALGDRLDVARAGMTRNGMIWVSWPKQASSLASEIGRAEVMAAGKRRGLVDVKVCAVDGDWSGLKFVIPVRDRR